MTKYITIYIDESGTLPDPKDKVVIVAAVGTSSTTQITKIIKSIKHSEIFVLVVEKAGKSIPDSPENFALLCWFILEDCLALHRHRKTRVIFDRHFHKLSDQNQFNTILTRLLGFQTEFSHEDSQKNPLINAADMVAGSLLWAQTGKDSKFYEIIKKRVLEEKVINWREIKRRFWTQKNVRTDASTHPDI